MDWLQEIREKYQSQGHDPEIFLQGLFYSRPLTYWDYIEVETLLSLQHPRTDFPDEKVFIVYHQAIELFLNLLLHELHQLLSKEEAPPTWREDKLNRICRYADILNSTFKVMNEGMDYDQYNAFRTALAPASGFQSAQYRQVEILCTPAWNLLHPRYKTGGNAINSYEDFYDKFYWREAGTDPRTGQPGLMLREFDNKYKKVLLATLKQWQGKTLCEKAEFWHKAGELTPVMIQKLRELDNIYNVQWPLTHLQTAEKYLAHQGEEKTSTGASPWRRYLHPAHQRRIFFPFLWSAEEKENWGRQ